MRYEGELVRESGVIDGGGAYVASTSRWSRDGLELLPNLTTAVTRISEMQSRSGAGGVVTTEVAVNWQATWSPESVSGLLLLGQSFGWKVRGYM